MALSNFKSFVLRVKATLESWRSCAALEVTRSDVRVLSVSELKSSSVPESLSYSLISTVKNESSNIKRWLDSLAAQSMLPAEIIVCDGGSTDGTQEIIREWIASSQLGTRLQLIENSGANIAKGRNSAAQYATSQILLFTDAGCIVDTRWAEYLLRGFADTNRSIEVVMGFYDVEANSALSRDVVQLTLPKCEHIDPEVFLPSARSLALTQKAFQKTGGFPEMLTFAGEDSLFDIRLKQVCGKFAFVPDARVLWQFPHSASAIWKTIFRYSRGDAESGVTAWKHYLRLLKYGTVFATLFAASVFGVILSICLAPASPALPILQCVLFGAGAFALLQILGPYSWFVREVESIPAKIRRVCALGLVLSAQYSGFLLGLVSGQSIRLEASKYLHLAERLKTQSLHSVHTL